MYPYHNRWATVFGKVQTDCRVKDYLLLDKPKAGAKELTGSQILRKFMEYIKRPIIKAAAEVIKHLDMTIGGKPRSGQTWKDILKIIKEWWRKQELRRKELDRRRRAAKAFNKTQSVVDGTDPPQKIPEVLPSSWVVPELRPNKSFEDPFIPLIARFVPRLCVGLGFPASPSCFTGKAQVRKFQIKRKRDGEHSEARSTSRALSRNRDMQQKKKYRTETEVSVHTPIHILYTNTLCTLDRKICSRDRRTSHTYGSIESKNHAGDM